MHNKFFWDAFFELHSVRENCLWRSIMLMSCWTQGTFQTVRWLYELILFSIGHFEGQLKSNWTVGKRLLAIDQCRIILFKGQWTFLIISKKLSLKHPLSVTRVHNKLLRFPYVFANQSYLWSDISRNQLKSNWRVGESLIASDQQENFKNTLNLSKAEWFFFNAWFENSFIFKTLCFKEPLADVMLHSGNWSDCQMVLRTDQIVNQTFPRSYWSPTEKLVKGCKPPIS